MKEYQYLTMTAKTTRDENVYCYGYIDDNKVHCLTATNDSYYLYFYEDLNIKDCGQVRPSTTMEKETLNYVLEKSNMKIKGDSLCLFLREYVGRKVVIEDGFVVENVAI